MARVEAAFFDRTQSMNNVGNFVTADVPYFVFDAADEDDAILSVHAATGEWFGRLLRASVEIEERINESTFRVVVHYQQHQVTDDGDEPEPVETFETSGGTQHLTQSIATAKRYPESAPDYGGAIGYDGERVAGVEVVKPIYSFSETHHLPRSVVTEAFRAKLARKTGMVNDASFRGFEAGEVLFMGANGTRRGTGRDDLWEISYRFSVSRTRRDFSIGGIAITEKLGWNYLWVRYADQVDEGAQEIVKRPVAVYVEKVYETTSFTGLGI